MGTILHKDLLTDDLHLPKAHKTSHQDGGADEITLSGLISTLPIYTNNATALAGGLVPGQSYRLGGDPDHVCIVH